MLNTWHGRPEEKWSSQTSSFLQVNLNYDFLLKKEIFCDTCYKVAATYGDHFSLWARPSITKVVRTTSKKSSKLYRNVQYQVQLRILFIQLFIGYHQVTHVITDNFCFDKSTYLYFIIILGILHVHDAYLIILFFKSVKI